MRLAVISFLLLVAGLCGAGSVAAQDLQSFVLASSCLACHGDGSPNGAGIPAIAGQQATLIGTAMREFRAGERQSTVMQRLARGYNDDEIDRIATWFAGQPGYGK